ncbi:MAG: HEAT repeat domain-containing protein [bacterium]|nr:HEAT repeat domain-containing protein [bacterium]
MRWTFFPALAVFVCWFCPAFVPAGLRADDPQPTVRELKAQLRAAYPDKRRRAVKKLAALGTEDAWELVFGALEDREPEVADEAQVWIAKVADTGLRKRLLGREGLGAKDDWVRLRVAEAFGRMEGGVTLRGFSDTELQLVGTG